MSCNHESWAGEGEERTMELADICDDQGHFTVISEELGLVLGLQLSTHRLSAEALSF